MMVYQAMATIFIYYIASKVTHFQPSNLPTLSACSIIVLTFADDAMKPLKCISVGLSMGLQKLNFDKTMSLL